MRLDAGQIEVVDEVMSEILKDKTPAERLSIAHGLWRSARQQLISYLHALHPEWDEAQIQREVARRLSHGAI